mgnify:CR=1 FL=1
MTGLVIIPESRETPLVKVPGVAGRTFVLGRALSCDLIVSDPYVAPVEAVLHYAGDNWVLKLVDAVNPVLLNGESLGTEPVPLPRSARLTVGRSRLRLIAEDAEVEPARRLTALKWLDFPPRSLAGIVVLMLTLAGIDGVADYLLTSTTLKWQRFAFIAVYSSLVVLAWAGLWAGIGHVLRHHHQFRTQLKATTVMFGAAIVAFNVVPYIEYPLASLWVHDYLAGWGIPLVLATLLIRCNLHFASNLERPGVVAAIAVFGLGGLSVAWTEYLRREVVVAEPRHPDVVRPPFANVASAAPFPEFLDEVEASFARHRSAANEGGDPLRPDPEG